MIILRDKTYSSKSLRLVRQYRKLANSNTITKIDNAGLRAGDSVKRTVKGMFGKRPVNSPADAFRFSPKKGVALNREAVEIKQGVNNVVNTPIGRVVDNGIKTAIQRPDVAIVAAASQVTTPVGLAIGGPVGAALTAPGYSAAIPVVQKVPLMPNRAIRAMKKVSDRYGKTNFSKSLRNNKTTIKSIGNTMESGYGRMSVPTGMVPVRR